MKEEEAKDFCDKRRAEVDRWLNAESRQERVGVAYWFNIGKQEFRIFEVGCSLVEVVERCQEKEEKLKEESNNKKDKARVK